MLLEGRLLETEAPFQSCGHHDLTMYLFLCYICYFEIVMERNFIKHSRPERSVTVHDYPVIVCGLLRGVLRQTS